jgi:hydrogenase maturation protease
LPANAPILVIGVGNEHRTDDAVGLNVARHLRQLSLENVMVIEENGEGANLLESWKGADTVIIVDAASSGAKPGTVHCIDARKQQIPTGLLHHSTHTFSVGDAVELARVMDRLPPHMLVYGIEGEEFEEGMGLSQAVEESVDRVAELVLKRVRTLGPRWGALAMRNTCVP